jgi:quercetin dioxygenase-like cupin family protein
MKIVKITDCKFEDNPVGAFIGEVKRQRLVNQKMSSSVTVLLVNCGLGAKSTCHSHNVDHALYVLNGKGIVATESEEQVVTPGMVAFIPAGERHWHGATKDSILTFLAVSAPGQATLH